MVGLARRVLYEGGMRRPQFVTACVWLLAGVVAAVPAAAGPGRGDGDGTARGPWFRKLDRRLQRTLDDNSGSGGGQARVIIRTRAGSTLTGSALFERLAKRKGAHERLALSLLDGVATEVDKKDLEALASLPEVEGISVDAPVQAHQSSYDACSTWV